MLDTGMVQACLCLTQVCRKPVLVSVLAGVKSQRMVLTCLGILGTAEAAKQQHIP